MQSVHVTQVLCQRTLEVKLKISLVVVNVILKLSPILHSDQSHLPWFFLHFQCHNVFDQFSSLMCTSPSLDNFATFKRYSHPESGRNQVFSMWQTSRLAAQFCSATLTALNNCVELFELTRTINKEAVVKLSCKLQAGLPV